MKRTPLAAMLTLLAAVAATVVMAGCGGKTASGGSNATPTKSTPTSTTTTRKLPSKAPSY